MSAQAAREVPAKFSLALGFLLHWLQTGVKSAHFASQPLSYKFASEFLTLLSRILGQLPGNGSLVAGS